QLPPTLQSGFVSSGRDAAVVFLTQLQAGDEDGRVRFEDEHATHPALQKREREDAPDVWQFAATEVALRDANLAESLERAAEFAAGPMGRGCAGRRGAAA